MKLEAVCTCGVKFGITVVVDSTNLSKDQAKEAASSAWMDGKDIGEYYVDNEKKAARVNFDEIAFQRCSSENNGGTHALDRIIS
ncbi:hypothetical protein A2872_03895 [Candidatus Gottesmanbacteria bacterium RIFCSPHIGHO2_01_FULL_42_12]|uniref:Uncharacterized protein n=1 Tax=Candidatus Gottesmanbacteria bacterium RIFCSPHIGHO2_01_FULL_42_12 TaxID=1798377 RepID=A0A1F5Z5E0_9BACT|nr:MAG: hypothetical protein A2872_03895 [Candidatus Gottesmanbacteria bacterium RIFCSPHIGHO2_01_FULL_42_12]